MRSSARGLAAFVLALPLLLTCRRTDSLRPAAPTVTPALKSSPGLAYVPSSPVGTMDSAFAVDGNGTATYRMVLTVPPGTAGVQPNIEINYDHRRGNGYLGMGWAISGISAISRCGATYALDGYKAGVAYDARDRFCVDGRPLIAVSGSYGAAGTVYHGEQETWTVFTSHGTCGSGPCSFTAINKDGSRMSFGATTGTNGSRILAQGRSDGSVRTWSIDQQSDLNGNYSTVSYFVDQATGEYYPTRIDYSANDAGGQKAQRAVTFDYDARDAADVMRRYLGGAQVQISRRMARINTVVDGAVSQTFRLAYDSSASTKRTRLVSVTPCDAAGVCQPPMSFTWQTASLGFNPPAAKLPGPLYILVNKQPYPSGVLQDFDGDGIADYAQAAEFVGSGTKDLRVWRGNRDGSFTLAGYSLPGPLYRVTSTNVVAVGVLQDINGDGLLDFSSATQNFDSGKNDYSVWLGSGNGFTRMDWSLPGPVFIQSNQQTFQSGILIDLNGDGLPDYSRATHVLSTGQKLLDISKGTGTGFTATGTQLPGAVYAIAATSSQQVGIVRDINGDGIADYSAATVNADSGTKDLWVWLGVTPGFTFTKSFELPGQMLWRVNGQVLDSGVLVDINGDGIPDYSRATYLPANGQQLLDVHLGTGAGYTSVQFQLPGPVYVIQPGRADIQGVLTDYNADGTARYSRATQFLDGRKDLAVYLGNGTGFRAGGFSLPDPLFKLVDQSTYDMGIYEDLNGDGLTDFANSTCTLEQSGALGQCVLDVRLAQGPFSDLLKTATNGFNGTTTVDYAPLTDPNVYTRTGAPGYPVREADGTMFVVSRYASGDGRGASYAFSYRYTGGRLDVLGRDWLGFTTVTMKEDASNRATKTTYSMTYPFYGLATDTEVTLPNGNRMENTRYEYVNASPPQYQALGIYQPLQKKVVITSYQNGAPVYAVERRMDYDQFGNVTIQSAPGDSAMGILPRYDCIRYDNDASPSVNRLGYPSQYKIARTYEACTSFLAVPREQDVVWNPATDVRWVKYTYDARKNVTAFDSYDDSHASFLTIGYGLDVYGNTTSVTTPGGTTSFEYDPTYRTFLSKITSAPLTRKNGTNYHIVSTYEFEPRFGVLTRSVDANGNVKTQDVDRFGRPVAVWGPDPNGAPKQLTLVQWKNEGGAFFSETRSRPSWDNNDPATWYWDRTYADGLLREYKWEEQGLKAGKAEAIVRQIYFDAEARIVRQSSPHYASDPEPITSTDYDEYNRPWRTTNPSGIVERIEYANGGLQITRTDAYGTPDATTAIEHIDPLGRPRQFVSANGQNTSFVYDTVGQTTNMTMAPETRTSTFAFDSLGRMRSSTSPDSGTMSWDFDAAGLLRSITDGSGNKVSFDTYDALGRVTHRTATWSGGISQIDYTYDETTRANGMNHLTSVAMTDPAAGPSTYAYGYTPYDEASAAEVTMGGRTYLYGNDFDPLGRPTNTYSPDGAVTTIVFDAGMNIGRVDVTEPGANAATTYGTFSNYIALGHPQDMRYDPSGVQLAQRYYPDNVAYGRLESLDAISTKQANAALLSLTYQWNAVSAVSAITDNLRSSRSQTFGYRDQAANNGMSFLTSARGAYGTKSYTYQKIGNIETQNGVSYAYEPNTDLLASSSDGVTYEFGDNGFLKTRTAGGVSQEYTFNADGLLAKVEQTAGGTKTTASAAYDHAGRKIFEQPLGSAQKVWWITNEYEVTDLGNDNFQHTRYVGGPAGTFATVTLTGAAAPANAASVHRHRMLARLNGGTAIGSRLSARYHAFMAVAHSPQGQEALVWIVAILLLLGAAALAFFGRRRTGIARMRPATAAVAPFVALCLLVATSRNAYGDLTPGSNGAGVPTAGRLFIVNDLLGSTISVVNDDGVETASLSYEPYGRIDQPSSSGTDNFRPKFAAKEWMEGTQSYDFGSRRYDPGAGRFVSPDPAAQFRSPYVYAGNNPASMIDPTGEFAFLAAVVIGAIVGAYFGAAAVNHDFNPLHWDWNSGKTYAGLLIGAAIGAVGAAAGGLVTEIGVAVGSLGGTAAQAAGIAIGIAGEALIGAGENAAFTALGGGSSKDIEQAAIEGAFFGAIFGGVSMAGSIGSRTARSTERRVAGETAETVEDVTDALPCPCTCASSFVAGTKVLTGSGALKPIEQVGAGDRVASADLSGARQVAAAVTEILGRETSDLVEIRLDGGVAITATPEHPFFVRDRGWVNAGELAAGWELVTESGRTARVAAVTPRQTQTPVAVHNFEVAGTHNYYVSDARVLVHNPKGKSRARYCKASIDAKGIYTEKWNDTELQKRFTDKKEYQAIKRDIRAKLRNANKLVKSGKVKPYTKVKNPVTTASREWVRWKYGKLYGKGVAVPKSVREGLETIRPQGWNQDVDESISRLWGGLTVREGMPENQLPMHSFANSTSGAAAKGVSNGPVQQITAFKAEFTTW